VPATDFLVVGVEGPRWRADRRRKRPMSG